MPIGVVDLRFIPDDTYYTLAIARNLALGNGPISSGGILTNGFQPLLAFLEMPAFWLGVGADAAIGWAVGLGVAFDLLAIVVLWKLIDRTLGRMVAAVAGVLWASSALATQNALGGLETSMALCCGLSVLLAFCAYRDRPTSRQAVVIGIACGLALLARIDLAVLVLGVVIVAIVEKRPWPHLLTAAAVALIVLAPWWSYSLVKFGAVVPQSGAAIVDLVRLNTGPSPPLLQRTGWALGFLVGLGVGDWRWAREFLYFSPFFSACLAALISIGGIAALWVTARATRSRPLTAGVAFAVFVVGFYVNHVPALWFFHRYLYPAQLAVIVCVAALTAALLSRGHKTQGIALAFFSVAVGIAQIGTWYVAPIENLSSWYHGAKGYRSSTVVMLESTPPRETLCAFQSGALGYFSAAAYRTDLRVVNLDGVVNKGANAAIKRLALSEYAYDVGCTYFADWKVNVDSLYSLSRHSQVSLKLASVAVGHPQGSDQFVLYRMEFSRSNSSKSVP